MQTPKPTARPAQRETSSRSPRLCQTLAVGALALLGAGVAVIAWSRNAVPHRVPLRPVLSGELIRFRGRRAGELAYYAHGPVEQGVPPLVFLHSINAAASSVEMKPLYDHYAQTRRVIALDLPGFGFSERVYKTYTPALYRDAILDLIEQEFGGAPVDTVALSLSGEFLALAAQAEPHLFRSLTFLSATGFSWVNPLIRPNDVLLRVLEVPHWRRPVYDVLTARPSLALFLQATRRTTVERELIDNAYAASHQPNAEHAPFHFIAFKLFTPNIFDVYRSLRPPCLTVYGQGPFVQYDRADELSGKPNWRIVALEDAGALVHWDNPNAVIEQMDKMLRAVDSMKM